MGNFKRSGRYSLRVNISIGATQLIANRDNACVAPLYILFLHLCVLLSNERGYRREREKEREKEREGGKKREKMYTRRYINILVIYSKQESEIYN